MTDKLMGGNAPVPAYMAGVGTDAAFGGGLDGNLYPRLSFKGSRFRIRNGEDEIVLKTTEIDVIILKDYPAISRIYFGKGYDPDDTEGGRPACGSADGERPLPTVPHPQGALCATCPQNEKGSKITDDGRKGRACGYFKRMVMIVVGYEAIGPVIADMKSMTIFGESNPDANWWSLKAYTARLKQNGVLPFQIITKLAFDIESSVPKLMFQPTGYVSEATFVEEVAPLVSTPDGEKLLLTMIDTNSMRMEGEDSENPAPALGLGDKPKHLSGPDEAKSNVTQLPSKPPAMPTAQSLSDQLDSAVAAGDYAKAAKIKAQLDAETGRSEPAKPEPKGPSNQDIIDSLKVDIKLAVEKGDYAKAADLKLLLEKHMSGGSVPEAPKAEAPKRTRAKKGAAPAQPVPAPPVAEQATASTAGEDISDDIAAALKAFGFE